MAVGVRLRNMDELLAVLRRTERGLGRELGKVNQKVAATVLPDVRRAIPDPYKQGTPKGATASRAQRAAKLTFTSVSKRPTIAAILGADTHPIPFGPKVSSAAGVSYRQVRKVNAATMRRRVWEPHLGSSWQPEDLYQVGPILERLVDTEVADIYFDTLYGMLEEFFSQSDA